MSSFQFISGEYRLPDCMSSGLPILGISRLAHMREKTRTEFGRRVFDSRKDAGLTQVQLAAACDLAQSTIAEMETIATGSSYTPRVARALAVSADWLATGDGERQSSAWPFPDIDRARFDDLLPNQKIEIQGVVWS